MPTGLYLGFDSKLPHRIKKYVESNQLVDVDWMVESLQKEYRKDYGKRRKKSFRLLVDKVYQSMLDNGELSIPVFKKMKLEQDCNDSDVLDSSNEESCYEYEFADRDLKQCFQDTNFMNQSLVSMYNKVEDEKDLVPSCSPQHFQMSEDDQASGETNKTSWVLDRSVKGDIKVMKPVKASDKGRTPKQKRNPSVHQIQLEQDNLKPKFKRQKLKKANPKKKLKKKASNDTNNDDKKESFEEFTLPANEFTLKQPDVTFADVAGNDDSLRELSRLLLHMTHPEIYRSLGVSPPRGVLLHGPPGCGKSLLGCAIAGQLGLPLLKLVGPELVTGVSGESERRIRDVFDTAISSSPCVLFLDEIDAVAQKRENASKDMERRMVAQLLACLDDLNKDQHQVMVVGATNKPDALDPALRRAGRFDREICLGIPDAKARKQILRVVCKDLKMADDMNFDLIAHLTPGYVGADLLSLCREAAMRAVARILNLDGKTSLSATRILDLLKDPKPFPEEELQNLSVETSDFEQAVPDVQPSAKREGFATVPDVTWNDIGALENIREELSIAILGPVRNPAAFAALGLTRASGVLLAGPPGCGKTLLAKAIANESGINFISVKGPELLNMYVGESERAVRRCFERARNSSPCVIFFDELDSLCPRRSAVESSASARVVNQMLTELDGLESRKQVFVMAATNRPDIIDPAVLRPGRLDKTLYVGIPSPLDRVKILRTLTKNGTRPPLSTNVSLDEMGRSIRCDGFTGADLSALVREASLNAIRGTLDQNWGNFLPNDVRSSQIKVTKCDFDIAFDKVCPSITKKDRALYEEMKSTLQG